MTKEEATENLIDWLNDAKKVVKVIKAEDFESCKEWFSQVHEMQTGFAALTDDTTGEDMPIDKPTIGADVGDFVPWPIDGRASTIVRYDGE